MFDQIKEKLEQWLSSHEVVKRVEALEQKVLGAVTPQAIQETLEQWGRSLTASFEERFGLNLSALEQRFLPVSFRTELDSSLSKWCEQAFASLEERAVGVVRNELERLKGELLAKVEPVSVSSPEVQGGAPEHERAPEQIDPLSLARDAFPTLQEFTQIGYYADTYEHRKAEWEARKAAANAQEIGPANVATGV